MIVVAPLTRDGANLVGQQTTTTARAAKTDGVTYLSGPEASSGSRNEYDGSTA